MVYQGYPVVPGCNILRPTIEPENCGLRGGWVGKIEGYWY